MQQQKMWTKKLKYKTVYLFILVLVVWVPVSFLLPTLAHHDAAYYRSGRLASIHRRTSSSPIHAISSTINDINKASYDPNSTDYKFDPFYGPLLSRLEAYFGLLRISDIPCRWKLLCHISMAPEDYKPISPLFRRLSVPYQTVEMWRTRRIPMSAFYGTYLPSWFFWLCTIFRCSG